ncbi:MAG: hypothetical protein CME70_19030 [Halobacteriovorax sp.]|nr:hypothetical protein [Halobacteriovorax sp.]
MPGWNVKERWLMKTPLEAAQKYRTKCDIIYDSFMDTHNDQFMQQIEEYEVDIGFLCNYIRNYYGEVQSHEVIARYAILAQAKLKLVREKYETRVTR